MSKKGLYVKFIFNKEKWYGTITEDGHDHYIIKVNNLYPHLFMKEDITIYSEVEW